MIKNGILDVVLSIAIMIFSMYVYIAQRNSRDDFRQIFEGIAAINFAGNASTSEKIDSLFKQGERMQHLVADQTMMVTVAFVFIIVLTLRIIVSTSAHPRLGLITGTVTYAFDDLVSLCVWHFRVCMCVCVYVCEQDLHMNESMANNIPACKCTRSSAPHHTHCTAPHCTAAHHTALHFTALQCTHRHTVQCAAPRIASHRTESNRTARHVRTDACVSIHVCVLAHMDALQVHFLLLTAIIYMSLAVCAYFVFGSHIDSFKSIQTTLISQLQLFVGEPFAR